MSISGFSSKYQGINKKMKLHKRTVELRNGSAPQKKRSIGMLKTLGFFNVGGIE
jgi:hypothetical protein